MTVARKSSPGNRFSLRFVAPLALAGVLGFGAVVKADLVHLNTGGVVKGEIVSETPEEVTVKTAGGITKIFREDIKSIERGKSGGDIYKEKLKGLDAKDADGHYRLGLELRGLRMDKEAKDCFERAIKIDPNHFPAKIALNEGAARASAGLTVEKEDVEKETAVSRGKLSPDAYKALKEAKALLSSDDPAARAQGWSRIDSLMAGEGSIDVLDAILQAVLQVEKDRRAAYEKNAGKVQSLLQDAEKPAEKKAREKYLAAWSTAVKAALETIFDLKIYPDENHGKAGQKFVDEKVKAVKDVYAVYEPLLLHDLSRISSAKEEEAKAFSTAFDRSRTLHMEALAGAEVAIAWRADPGLGTDETAAPVKLPALKELPKEPAIANRALLLYRAGRIDEAYALKDRLSGWEQQLLYRLRDIRVEQYNERVLSDKAAPAKGKRPNGEERKQVEITNKYRIMMGKDAIEIHTCLVESARGHSQEMTQLGYFEHESPVEKNRTPSDRARNAGYEGGAAENISLGSVSAQATHDAWYNSSGHHRNILGNHRAMGSGLDGQHWTQNFGGVGLLER